MGTIKQNREKVDNLFILSIDPLQSVNQITTQILEPVYEDLNRVDILTKKVKKKMQLMPYFVLGFGHFLIFNICRGERRILLLELSYLASHSSLCQQRRTTLPVFNK